MASLPSPKSARVNKAESNLTADERDAARVLRVRQAARPSVPRVRVTKTGRGPDKVELDHADSSVATTVLMRAFGTGSLEFLGGLLAQTVNVASKGQSLDETATNFMLAAIAGAAPQDDIEAMLAAQMASAHLATMTFARRLAQGGVNALKAQGQSNQ